MKGMHRIGFILLIALICWGATMAFFSTGSRSPSHSKADILNPTAEKRAKETSSLSTESGVPSAPTTADEHSGVALDKGASSLPSPYPVEDILRRIGNQPGASPSIRDSTMSARAVEVIPESFVEYDDFGGVSNQAVATVPESSHVEAKLEALQLEFSEGKDGPKKLYLRFQTERNPIMLEELLVIASTLDYSPQIRDLYLMALAPNQPQAVRLQSVYLLAGEDPKQLFALRSDSDLMVRNEVLQALGMESSIDDESEAKLRDSASRLRRPQRK